MSDNTAPDMSGIDPALLQDFISESQEILDGLDPLFVALESNPDDLSIVDGIFRPVHSVKGNSGFFGLTNIKKFAHIMENLLGEIRSRKRKATPPLIDLLLKGVDFLRGMMNRLAQGDLSGQFTPEEENHLGLLNQVSGEGGGGEPDTPEAAAKKTMEALDALKANQSSADALAKLEEAIKGLITITVKGFFDKAEEAGGGEGEVTTSYRIGPDDVTSSVTNIETFIKNLIQYEKEEAMCESFLTSLQIIEDAGSKSKEEIVGLVEQIKDDFITIHESGIGFDDLMASLIRERFDAIMKLVDKVEIAAGSDFFINGENITDLITMMQEFIGGVKEKEKESGPTEAFTNGINTIKDMASKKPDLLAAIEQLQDDFLTIHESGIGFDDLMASLLQERLQAIMSLCDRGSAAKFVYKLGGTDVSQTIQKLEAAAKAPADIGKDAAGAAEFGAVLAEYAKALEAAGKADVAGEATALAADAANIGNSGAGVDDNMAKMFAERIGKLIAAADKEEVKPEPAAKEAEKKEDKPADKPADAPKPAAAPAQGGGAHHEASGKTLRVAEEKVDHFMSFVGELIITGEVFAYIQKKLEQYPEVRQVTQEFKLANQSFAELSSNLQKSLMEVRRVPLKSVLQKLHRIIRDTSAQLGKKIDLEIIGEDVQIDKSLLEGLESPLVHMVRNSVDHGVEVPEERVAAGKPETGKVTITASATEEQFKIAIKDDGKGLDVDTLKNKAVSKGLITEDQARNMPDKDAFRLIFNAGLSTAKVVTDISGRGVGMDVVLSNITKMNGNIGIESTKGSGSTFTISLPMTVTLTVIDGLVARIGDQFYIIPLSDVRESVKPAADQVHVIRGSQEVLNVRGELHPIAHLNQVLGIYTGDVHEEITETTAVLVQGKRGVNAAFLVDELIGQQSVVVKELGKEFENIRCLQGGSILGDGRVGLVLSVEGILQDLGLSQGGD